MHVSRASDYKCNAVSCITFIFPIHLIQSQPVRVTSDGMATNMASPLPEVKGQNEVCRDFNCLMIVPYKTDIYI